VCEFASPTRTRIHTYTHVMMIAFITINSGLVRLIEGLCAQI